MLSPLLSVVSTDFMTSRDLIGVMIRSSWSLSVTTTPSGLCAVNVTELSSPPASTTS